MARPTSSIIRSYADDLRLFPTAAKRIGLVVLIAAYLLIPYLINDTWAGADPGLVDVAAEWGAGLVCSHTGGLAPRTDPRGVEYADVMADVVSWLTGQEIQLLGMMTEAMHNPFLMDRYVALKSAEYVHRAWQSMGAEIRLRPGGVVERRADETLGKALVLLEEVAREGLMKAIGKARFGDIARSEDGGKGLSGVVERAPGYFNPFLDIMKELNQTEKTTFIFSTHDQRVMKNANAIVRLADGKFVDRVSPSALGLSAVQPGGTPA